MSTPMLEQYNKLKKANQDTILLFRLGDFYEAFDEDAKDISKILNITLTGRGKNENRKPMAGIPHHAIKPYLKKLVMAGRKVAIAEQMEEPQAGKIVEREIVKIITAGTITDIDSLEESANNYLAAVYIPPKSKGYCLAYCDLTTGEFKTESFQNIKELREELFTLHPNELITQQALVEPLKSILPALSIQVPEETIWVTDKNETILKFHFSVQSFKSFGYEKGDMELIPAGVILDYLRQTQKTDLQHIKKLTKQIKTDYMNLDPATINSLELVWPMRSENSKATLFGILNRCQTPMGQRKLRNWILHPLVNQTLLQNRHNAVEELIKDPIKLSQLIGSLDNICDMERIISKIGTGSLNARDLLFLKTSLQKIVSLYEQTSSFSNEVINMSRLLTGLELEKLIKTNELIDSAIDDDPPITITEGGFIKQGFNKELDEIKIIETHGKDWLKQLQAEEIQKTGISSLKVKFNNVFGYYIEISKSNLDKVPPNYIRKQTLVNAERFITQELKDMESKILSAKDRANQMEYDLFNQVKAEVSNHIETYQKLAQIISNIDVLSNFANLSRISNYVKPTLSDKNELDIKNGRHPVVEKFIESQYISNDTVLGDDQQIVVLTGPNMSGKSTFIRQIALIALMAQIGCFVPAKSATLPVFDRIFTRVGASDNLASGESTFMVEMNETANILNNATARSLIILDEVGRGTSTYDGVAIAWSIVEYIHEKIGAKTLFATHYHELIDLGDKLARVKNYNVGVIEQGDEVIFTRKIEPGGTDQSYGVHVAKMAGVPEEIIFRSKEILMTLEQESMLDVKTIESELIERKSKSEKKMTPRPKKAKISIKQLKLV